MIIKKTNRELLHQIIEMEGVLAGVQAKNAKHRLKLVALTTLTKEMANYFHTVVQDEDEIDHSEHVTQTARMNVV